MVIDFDVFYLNVYVVVMFFGVMVKVDYEILGFDDGLYGFVMLLVMLYKFNGWIDQFLGMLVQGLKDFKLFLLGGLVGGKWFLVYYDFSVDDSSNGVDDLGSEINVQYMKKFVGKYNFGIKYGIYDVGDIKVDINCFWMWIGICF